MELIKHCWVDKTKVFETVCCEELVKAEDIVKQDGEWSIFCEGCYLYKKIKFCPFCGSKLS